jgi:hypothetical protein
MDHCAVADASPEQEAVGDGGAPATHSAVCQFIEDNVHALDQTYVNGPCSLLNGALASLYTHHSHCENQPSSPPKGTQSGPPSLTPRPGLSQVSRVQDSLGRLRCVRRASLREPRVRHRVLWHLPQPVRSGLPPPYPLAP